jgi:hypothetical protein
MHYCVYKRKTIEQEIKRAELPERDRESDAALNHASGMPLMPAFSQAKYCRIDILP